MTEGLFVLTTLFVAYVIYVIINEKKTEGTAPKSTPVAQPKQQATVTEVPKAPAAKASPVAAKPAAAKPVVAAKKPVEVAEAPKPTPKVAPKPTAAPIEVASKPVPTPKAASKPVAATKPAPVVAAAVETVKGTGLKDPKTGEVATNYSNYRFTKRWIKEALVTENLVDKVYKNDELNAGVEAKIRAGIAKLESMKEYQA
jgi:outer membrane biosynthesis protein TonB